MTLAAISDPQGATVEGSVHSADGTRIGYVRLGEGPAIVFVHGSLSNHRDWMRVARILADRYTCILVDRRGRGRSQNKTPEYSMQKEFEDVAAVVARFGESTSVVAHSFGSCCAMGGALLAPVRKLVLYEPPYPINLPIAGENLVPYKAALASGDMDLALAVGMEHFIRLPLEVIAATRHTKAWTHMRGLIPTWLRELEVMDSHGPDLSAYGKFTAPTLLLEGSQSPENPFRAANRVLLETLPQARLSILEGQSHLAMIQIPDAVAERIAQFLAE